MVNILRNVTRSIYKKAIFRERKTLYKSREQERADDSRFNNGLYFQRSRNPRK